MNKDTWEYVHTLAKMLKTDSWAHIGKPVEVAVRDIFEELAARYEPEQYRHLQAEMEKTTCPRNAETPK